MRTPWGEPGTVAVGPLPLTDLDTGERIEGDAYVVITKPWGFVTLWVHTEEGWAEPSGWLDDDTPYTTIITKDRPA